MEKLEILSDNKFRWIARIYFNVASHPDLPVNPYNDLNSFMKGTVGDLQWGNSVEERNITKKKFCDHMMKTLDLYNYYIKKEDIFQCLSNESMINADIIAKWVYLCHFPEDK